MRSAALVSMPGKGDLENLSDPARATGRQRLNGRGPDFNGPIGKRSAATEDRFSTDVPGDLLAIATAGRVDAVCSLLFRRLWHSLRMRLYA